MQRLRGRRLYPGDGGYIVINRATLAQSGEHSWREIPPVVKPRLTNILYGDQSSPPNSMYAASYWCLSHPLQTVLGNVTHRRRKCAVYITRNRVEARRHDVLRARRSMRILTRGNPLLFSKVRDRYEDHVPLEMYPKYIRSLQCLSDRCTHLEMLVSFCGHRLPARAGSRPPTNSCGKVRKETWNLMSTMPNSTCN